MRTTQPIRDSRQLSQFINYYATTQPNQRNYTLIVIGLHTALRISDILTLQWKNVFDFKTTKCRTHLQIIEHKTGKKSKIALCPESQKALSDFYIMKEPNPEDYVFSAESQQNKPLSRSQAYRIVRTAAEKSIHEEHISCHSLRKTFGYHAWKQGVQPALLMDIYNHSSYETTKRYLGITQDERDDIFLSVHL